MRNLIFLEGPAYAGKTTYLNTLKASDVFTLPEASEFLGGDANFPDAPHDLASMLHCSYFFSFMENERLKRLENIPEHITTVIADRFTPLSSMLFYYLRYKAGAIKEKDYALGVHLCSKIFRDNLHLPSATFRHKFLLFNVASESEFVKRLARGTRNEDFNGWGNFQLLIEAYRKILPQTVEEIVSAPPHSGGGQWAESIEALHDLLSPKHFLPSELTTVETANESLQSAIKQHLPQKVIDKIELRVKELTL